MTRRRSRPGWTTAGSGQWGLGISRIEQPDKRNFCWWVRLGWSDGRPAVAESFPDKRYGGKWLAFAAAVRFRDARVAEVVR